MALTSSLPGLQPSCLMETGGVLEHSSLLENMESSDVRAGRDIRGQSVHPLLHSHFIGEQIKEQREKAIWQIKSRARPNWRGNLLQKCHVGKAHTGRYFGGGN